MCEPPRRSSSRRVERSALCNVRSSSSSSGVRRPGSNAGPPQDLVGQQVAHAGQALLVHQPRLERGDRARPRRRRQRGAHVGERGRQRVGPEPVLVGRQLEGAEAPRVVQLERAPVDEVHPGPHPLLVEDARAVAQPVERLLAVDDQPARHAEADAERRPAVGVEQHELAPAPRLGELVPGQGGPEARGRRPPTPVAGVDHPDLGHRAVQRLLGQGPVALDFEDLGHGRKVSDPWGRPNMVGPCHQRSRNGPSCSPRS